MISIEFPEKDKKLFQYFFGLPIEEFKHIIDCLRDLPIKANFSDFEQRFEKCSLFQYKDLIPFLIKLFISLGKLKDKADLKSIEEGFIAKYAEIVGKDFDKEDIAKKVKFIFDIVKPFYLTFKILETAESIGKPIENLDFDILEKVIIEQDIEGVTLLFQMKVNYVDVDNKNKIERSITFALTKEDIEDLKTKLEELEKKLEFILTFYKQKGIKVIDF